MYLYVLTLIIYICIHIYTCMYKKIHTKHTKCAPIYYHIYTPPRSHSYLAFMSLFFCMIMALSSATINSGNAVILCKERISNVKHLQLASGTSR